MSMFIFKTSGATFDSVIYNQKHAFRNQPTNLREGHLIIVSKNKNDCTEGEKQIQYRMFVDKVERVTPVEIEKYWPGNGDRWNYIVHCSKTVRLETPFDLVDVLGDKAAKYQSGQNYAQLDWAEENKVIEFLFETNPLVKNDYQPPVIPDDLEELILETQNYRPKTKIEVDIIMKLDLLHFPLDTYKDQNKFDEWAIQNVVKTRDVFRAIIQNRLYNNKGLM